MPDWESYLQAQQPRFRDELFQFLRIPSISALPGCMRWLPCPQADRR